jgi:hypothetical protein
VKAVNRRLLLLDVVLLLFAAGLVWLLRERYLDARAKEKAVLAKKVTPKPVLAPPLPGPLRLTPPADYVDVAQRMLFSRDRNPNVPVEAPPKPPPEPPMPALPIYHGQMAIGEPIAILSLPSQAATQKGYHAGDKIGEFKLIAFDSEKIELEWHGKTIDRKPEELVAKEAPPPPAPTAAAAPAGSNNAAARPAGAATPDQPAKAVTSLGGSSAGNSGPSGSPPAGIGEEIGAGVHNCLPGDDSPAGTVLNGYQKRLIPSMFGPVCRWELVK